MADAAVTLALRLQDEASPQMAQFATTTQSAEMASLQFNTALTAMGSALTAVGSLVNQIDNPMAKLAGTFITTGGAILSTTSAIITMIPQIRGLIGWLRNLAIAQTLVASLSGPIGWGRIAIGLGVAAAATAGIVAATGGFSGGGTQVNINTPAFVGNEADARKFAQKTQRFSRQNERLGR